MCEKWISRGDFMYERPALSSSMNMFKQYLLRLRDDVKALDDEIDNQKAVSTEQVILKMEADIVELRKLRGGLTGSGTD
jgi:glutaredoxin-related protein